MNIIYADFQNADSEGFVRLNCDGTRNDLEKLGLALQEGQLFILSDGEISCSGTVVAPGSERVWRARIDWKALFDSADDRP